MKMNTIWTVLFLLSCMGFWTGTSGSSISRRARLFRLSKLSQHHQFRHIYPSNVTVDISDRSGFPNSSATPTNHSWAICPILDKLLRQYMSGFPVVDKAIDAFNVTEEAINSTLRKVTNVFSYLKSAVLTEDLVINDIARMILDKRVNCTITMYQKVFIYVMMKEMDAMMARDETSMLSQVIRTIALHFPTRPDVIILAPQIVYGVHDTVFQKIIDSLRQAEFRYLDWYLFTVRDKIQAAFKTNPNPHPDVLFAKLAGILEEQKNSFLEVWTCTTPAEFIDIHKIVAGQFSDHFFKMLKTGYISAIVVGDINLLFRLPGNGLSGEIDMDDPNVDLVINELEKIILNYAVTVMNNTAAYEEQLTSNGLTEPPQDLLSLLSPSEVADTWTLFTRGFGPTPTPTGSGQINLTDVLNQGNQELNQLRNVTADLTEDNSTDPSVIAQLDNIISDKQNFLQRIEDQLQNTP